MSVFCHTQFQTNTSAPLKRPVGHKTEYYVSDVCLPHIGVEAIQRSQQVTKRRHLLELILHISADHHGEMVGPDIVYT